MKPYLGVAKDQLAAGKVRQICAATMRYQAADRPLRVTLRSTVSSNCSPSASSDSTNSFFSCSVSGRNSKSPDAIGSAISSDDSVGSPCSWTGSFLETTSSRNQLLIVMALSLPDDSALETISNRFFCIQLTFATWSR